MGDFAIDTAIEGGDGHYRARLSRDWQIWGPNGGYVAAIALRAAGAHASLPRPANFTCHFLSVADFAEVDLAVTTLRASKRAASVRVSMTQQQRLILEAHAWIVGDGDGIQHDEARMPSVPPVDRLPPIEELIPESERQGGHPFWQNLEARPIDWVHWEQRPARPPVWREWYRFRPRATFTDPFVDAARSLLLIDTLLWPAACQPYPRNSSYIAPSVDVSAYFHRLAPDSEWLLCDAAAPIAAHGLIGGNARIWTADGRLLASGGGQLLCRPSAIA